MKPAVSMPGDYLATMGSAAPVASAPAAADWRRRRRRRSRTSIRARSCRAATPSRRRRRRSRRSRCLVTTSRRWARRRRSLRRRRPRPRRRRRSRTSTRAPVVSGSYTKRVGEEGRQAVGFDAGRLTSGRCWRSAAPVSSAPAGRGRGAGGAHGPLFGRGRVGQLHAGRLRRRPAVSMPGDMPRRWAQRRRRVGAGGRGRWRRLRTSIRARSCRAATPPPAKAAARRRSMPVTTLATGARRRRSRRRRPRLGFGLRGRTRSTDLYSGAVVSGATPSRRRRRRVSAARCLVTTSATMGSAAPALRRPRPHRSGRRSRTSIRARSCRALHQAGEGGRQAGGLDAW